MLAAIHESQQQVGPSQASPVRATTHVAVERLGEIGDRLPVPLATQRLMAVAAIRDIAARKAARHMSRQPIDKLPGLDAIADPIERGED